jgi:hypothetical protein
LCNKFKWLASLLGIWAARPGQPEKKSNAHISQFVLQLDLHKPIYDKKGSATKLPFQKFGQISAGLVHTCAVGQIYNAQSEHENAALTFFAVLLKPNELTCSLEGTSNTVSMNAVCFGDTSYAQVLPSDTNIYGVPDRPEFYEFKQTQRCFTLQWKQISAGGYHSCGITVKDSYGTNQLICWGLKDDGQTAVMYPGAPASLPAGNVHHTISIHLSTTQLMMRFSELAFVILCSHFSLAVDVA